MAGFVKRHFNFSMKNIPIQNEDSFLKNFIHRTEDFITRLRWPILFFLKREEEKKKDNCDDCESDGEDERKETYGFRSTRIPPPIKEIEEFEQDLWSMVEGIQFNKKRTQFQKRLINEVKEIKKSKNLIIPADKTSNMYEVPVEKYNKLLKDNITKQYKKVDDKVIDDINKEAKKVTKKLDISDRVEKMPKKDAFITLKDHKQNFSLNPQCRLINPTKSEVGKISKIMLQNINSKIREKSGLQQWQSTNQAIEWFNSIENKQSKEFIQCDIESFYPTITESLLEQSLEFAQGYTMVPETTKAAILNARKTVLISNEEVWVKTDSIFDVAMGAFDGAEIAELVGLKILNDIREKVPEIDFGLYRDDGIAVIKTASGQKIENVKKKIIKVFKENDLKITIQTRLHKVDFLDVSFDLHENTYKPFKKPDNETKYINVHSNHPQNVKKDLPLMIEKRLSCLSKSKSVFDDSCNDYKTALRNSGHKDTLAYKENEIKNSKERKKKKTRKRKVIWYNPPYNEAVETNIGQQFLKLIDKHFGKKRKDNLHKIINRKTVKIGYSCGQNFGNIIKNHNKTVMKKQKETDSQRERKCNCRRGTACPLNGECLTEAIVYKAEIKTQGIVYIGSTEGPFKQRLYEHKSNMRIEKNKTKTTLSQYAWELKDRGVNAEIEWKIVRKCKKYESGDKKCDVCLSEKLEILKGRKKGEKMLNKRNELMYKCPHKRKFILEP